MNKIRLALLISIATISISTRASAQEITGHVLQNSTSVQKVCDALLLKNEPRCEHPDDYVAVAIKTKETETESYVEIEAVNALIKKDELEKYLDKNVKATLGHDEHLAHITEIVK